MRDLLKEYRSKDTVYAAEVTEDNFNDLIEWCDGGKVWTTIISSNEPTRRVPAILLPGVGVRAGLGQVLALDGDGFHVYSKIEFVRKYEEVK